MELTDRGIDVLNDLRFLAEGLKKGNLSAQVRMAARWTAS